MPQDPDWILPDNSLNMELYYKDHLLLIEDGNTKFSKSIMETLQVVLSPQSSSQSSSSPQSLSATATPFNPECHIFLLDTPTGQPKFQALPASRPFRRVFSWTLKTTFEHMLCAKPTKLIASRTSVSSSSEIPQLSQLKFQKSFSILLPFLYAVTLHVLFLFCPLLHPQLTPRFLLLHLHLAIFEFVLVFSIFLGRFLTLCMKTYHTALTVYHLNFLGKSFKWFLLYCFSHSYYSYLIVFFWVAQTKNHFKVKSP